MNTLEDGGGSSGVSGRFWAYLWGMDCVLELYLSAAGRLEGSLEADGEWLEVKGGMPEPDGAVRGVVRAQNLSEPFVTFRACTDMDGLFLDLEILGGELETAEHVAFARLG